MLAVGVCCVVVGVNDFVNDVEVVLNEYDLERDLWCATSTDGTQYLLNAGNLQPGRGQREVGLLREQRALWRRGEGWVSWFWQWGLLVPGLHVRRTRAKEDGGILG